MTCHVTIHNEGGSLWATVDEYPGVFATGDNMQELTESLGEGLSLVMTPEDIAAPAHLDSMEPVLPEHVEGRTLQLH